MYWNKIDGIKKFDIYGIWIKCTEVYVLFIYTVDLYLVLVILTVFSAEKILR